MAGAPFGAPAIVVLGRLMYHLVTRIDRLVKSGVKILATVGQ
jgi:hypothetical protein